MNTYTKAYVQGYMRKTADLASVGKTVGNAAGGLASTAGNWVADMTYRPFVDAGVDYGRFGSALAHGNFSGAGRAFGSALGNSAMAGVNLLGAGVIGASGGTAAPLVGAGETALRTGVMAGAKRLFTSGAQAVAKGVGTAATKTVGEGATQGIAQIGKGLGQVGAGLGRQSMGMVGNQASNASSVVSGLATAAKPLGQAVDKVIPGAASAVSNVADKAVQGVTSAYDAAKASPNPVAKYITGGTPKSTAANPVIRTGQNILNSHQLPFQAGMIAGPAAQGMIQDTGARHGAVADHYAQSLKQRGISGLNPSELHAAANHVGVPAYDLEQAFARAGV